jgi:hypothetical protein
MQIEIKEHNGYGALFVDGELFDWEMDVESLKEARTFCAGNSVLQKSVEGDIQRHFLESLSAFIGRTITLEELVAIAQ